MTGRVFFCSVSDLKKLCFVSVKEIILGSVLTKVSDSLFSKLDIKRPLSLSGRDDYKFFTAAIAAS